MDWTDLKRHIKLDVYMIPAANLNDSYGLLNDHVDISGATITEGYYTDTRIQAKLTVLDGAWIRQSFIRIVASVADWDYTEELGTFLVTNDDSTYENGVLKTSLSLESMLYALDVQKGIQPWTIKKDAYAKRAMQEMLNTCHRSYIMNTANDYRYGQNVTFETGTSYLERIFDICDKSNNRLDVDGHGNVIIKPYILPANRPVSFTIDLKSPTGIALDGISRSSNYLELPTECVVYHRYSESNNGDSEEKETRGSASNGGRFGYGERGYIITKVVNLSEMSPNNAERANQLAREYLARASVESVEWKLKTEYMPIRIGDVGYIAGLTDIPAYQGTQKVMVKSREIDLQDMTMSLTLKSTRSNDTDGEDM